MTTDGVQIKSVTTNREIQFKPARAEFSRVGAGFTNQKLVARGSELKESSENSC